jgi:hypothetical protein
MFQKAFFGFLLSLVTLVLSSAPTNATEVQIGTLDITGSGVDGNTVLTNLTSTSFTLSTLFITEGSNPPFPVGDGEVIAPGAVMMQVLSCGSCDSISYVFAGALGSLDFSIGGLDYTATTLDFTTPTFVGNVTTSVPVTIDAALVSSTTPEPASILLFSTGLVGIMLLLRKSLLLA